MRNHSKAVGLLLEIIMTMLFFCITCAILLQIFAFTRNLSDKSYSETQAMVCAQSIADQFRANAFVEQSFEADAEGNYVLYYDQTMQPATADSYYYKALVKISKQPQGAGSMDSASITIEQGDKQIHTLQVDQYRQKEAAQ